MASKDLIAEFLQREFPHLDCVVESVGNRSATLVRRIGPSDLRPGGTVSGPTLMTVADVALYVAILGEIGIVPLTVTTSLTMNFLRKAPADRNIVGVCRLLKLGRSLAIGEVNLHSEGTADLVAHAVGTYSIPQATR
jgi:acyl-coenzyme A thioesterase PaaI-like protein